MAFFGLFRKKTIFDLIEKDRDLQDKEIVDFDKVLTDLQGLAKTHALPNNEFTKLNLKLRDLRDIHVENANLEARLVQIAERVQNERIDIDTGKDKLKLLAKEKTEMKNQVRKKIRNVAEHLDELEKVLKKKEFSREAKKILRDLFKEYVILKKEAKIDKEVARSA